MVDAIRAVFTVGDQSLPSIIFASLGIFPGDEGVLFLAPVVTARMIAVNDAVHTALQQGELPTWPHYWPGRWIPHCTLALHTTAESRARAVSALAMFTAFQARVTGVGLVDIATAATTPLL